MRIKPAQYLAKSRKIVTGYAGNEVYNLLHYPAGLNCRFFMKDSAKQEALYISPQPSPANIVISKEEIIKALHKAGFAAN